MKKQFEISLEDTAIKQGSGDNYVLSTPRLIAFMENVAKDMISSSSVGYIMEIKHLAPTPCGALITIEATITEHDDRTYEFSIIAKDCIETIATARHVRVVVDKNRFQTKADNKLGDHNEVR